MNKLLLTASSMLLLAACAMDQYRLSETPGEMKDLSHEAVVDKALTVAGIDLWIKGVPDKKYIILGVIQDKRRNMNYNPNVYNLDISKLVRKAGGDAAIILIAESKIVDEIAQGCGSSPGSLPNEHCEGGGGSSIYSQNRESTDAPLEYRESHIMVIKYVK